jgi:hypothetical protein
MHLGPLLPLDPAVPLVQVLEHLGQGDRLGAWLRGCRRFILHESTAGCRRLILSPDLGFLLRHCDRVALKGDTELVVLETEKIIQWRALQVVTSSPYLQLLLPLSGSTPEEILGQLLARGIQVAESSITYLPGAMDRLVDATLFARLR